VRKVACITHDEVNEFWLRQRVEESGAQLHTLTLRDPLPNGEYDAVLIDGDSLGTDGRENLLAALLAHPVDGRIGLHSYSLNPEDARVLRRKGVRIFDRLIPDAIEWLLVGKA
jgi:hypothetical protein